MTPEALRTVQAYVAQAKQALACSDAAAAQQAYQQAHLTCPENTEILLDLAAACLNNRQAAQAYAYAQKAGLGSTAWRAQMVMASASKQMQQPDAATLHFHNALNQPSVPANARVAALQQLADIQLNAFGDARSAALSITQAATLKPALALESELATLVANLYEGNMGGAGIAAGFTALADKLHANTPAVRPQTQRQIIKRSRLRIGLISQQFCASPVGFFTLGAVSSLARNADLIFFDRGAKSDWANAAFKSSARHWLCCGMLDATQLYKLLLEADLDAVIDLSGWTDPPVLCALSARPVQKQLKWVGGQSLSTGMRCFDGFITDKRQVPPKASHLYTEPLLYASHNYITYTAPPYARALAAATARPPLPSYKPQAGVVAVASNPVKISHSTVLSLQKMRPRKLLLIDQRWQHKGTLLAAQSRLGNLLDVAEFVTPPNHVQYLAALQDLDATFLDTSPYAMGLSAVELRLLGKHICAAPRSVSALMYERHCTAHLGSRRFDHHEVLAKQLQHWCQT